MTTELAIRPEQTTFDDKQLAALRAIGVQNAPPADIALFFHQAARTGLDPFARQIYLINRGGKNTIQVGIDGFRLIRDRTGNFQGQDEEWCGPDGVWKDVWLETEPPAAAKVSVYVKGYARPVVGIALWSEYAQIGRDGKPQSVWASKPALMLAKCAEALALRKAYPQDLSGLYTSDELPAAEQDEDGVYVTTTMRSTPAPARNTQNSRKTPEADRHAVADEWAARARNALTVTDARDLYRDAKHRGILGYPLTSGELLEDVLRARGEQLADEAAHAAGEHDEATSDALYDDALPY